MGGPAPSGDRVELDIIIYFPWDPRVERFAGERIYYDSGAFARQLGAIAQRPTRAAAR